MNWLKRAIGILLCMVFVFASVVVFLLADVWATELPSITINFSQNFYECVGIILFFIGFLCTHIGEDDSCEKEIK